jgi:hypothetical protein
MARPRLQVALIGWLTLSVVVAVAAAVEPVIYGSVRNGDFARYRTVRADDPAITGVTEVGWTLPKDLVFPGAGTRTRVPRPQPLGLADPELLRRPTARHPAPLRRWLRAQHAALDPVPDAVFALRLGPGRQSGCRPAEGPASALAGGSPVEAVRVPPRHRPGLRADHPLGPHPADLEVGRRLARRTAATAGTIRADLGQDRLRDAWALRPHDYDEPQQPVATAVAPTSVPGCVTVELPPFRYHTMLVLRVVTSTGVH